MFLSKEHSGLSTIQDFYVSLDLGFQLGEAFPCFDVKATPGNNYNNTEV